MKDNKNKEHNNGGRPPKFKTPEELQEMVDKYFEEVTAKDSNQKITITGLCLYLGFCDRHSFYDYEKREGFSHTIKTARLRIETHYEGLLQVQSSAGPIFALKNFGWKDKQEIEQQSETSLTIVRKVLK